MRHTHHAILVTIAALLASSSALAQTASTATLAAHAQVSDFLPFDDTSDFADAKRGFIATLDDPVIRGDKGNVAYSGDVGQRFRIEAGRSFRDLGHPERSDAG